MSYIPAESGLRGSTWTIAAYSSIIFSADGYSASVSSNTYDIISYGKRPDNVQVIVVYSYSSSSNTPHFFSSWIINGNTLTYGDFTYTRQ